MSSSFGVVRALVTTASAISPRLGGRAALAAFFSTQPRATVREADQPTIDRARLGTVRVRDLDLITYEWGGGAATVLLVHGWRGRASQFSPLVRELVAEGFRVVSFDAPAHGGSPGARTDVRDWVAAIEALHALHGRFRLIVGHSIGAFAALTAVRHGVASPAVAAIGGAGAPAMFLEQFATVMRLGAATRRRLEQGFLRRFGEDAASLIPRYDAIAHPLPAEVELLAAHDTGDRQMPAARSAELVAAHAGRARLLTTTGFGHTRILGADPVLDAITALATGGLAATGLPTGAMPHVGAAPQPIRPPRPNPAAIRSGTSAISGAASR